MKFKKGDYCYIKGEEWDEWRETFHLMTLGQTGLVEVCLYDDIISDAALGYQYIKVQWEGRRWHCPVHLLRDRVLDKRAISNLLVRM